ncbi:MAG TPA: hypothetical protein VFE94_00355 [Candidatus Paceibacterota bacterium]|nr:hypothetical protein [Candidatus Paceibacterota bacterium]
MIPFYENIFPAALFWFLVAMLFAAIEIEIEGKHGWAEKTSTWFRTKGLAARLYGLAMGGKPLTGYHLFMFFLPLLVVHSHFVMGVPWSVEAELLALALYFVWMPTWDFLWFVLNPYYGVKKFKKQKVWWHARSHWLFNITPLDYLFGWGLSVVLAVAATLVADDLRLVFWHLHFMVWFFFFTVLTILLVAPLYKRWHAKMRQRDDREASGIFHAE